MTINEALTKHAIISKIQLNSSYSKELKVKIMRIRRLYNKIRQDFDSDIQEFSKELITEDLQTLANKQDRTPEEEAKFKELNDTANASYQEYVGQKGKETIADIEDTFSEDEYADILDANSDADVNINNVTVNGTEFMEVFYTLFVK